MFEKIKFLLQVIVLQTMGELACAAKVRFIPQNEYIFTDCPNQPSNILNIDGLIDFTNVEMKMNEQYNVIGKGNATTIWNIEKNDQVQGRFEILKFERGSWTPTMYQIVVTDLCKVLYDKNQLWYKFYTRHILNSDDIKDNCFNVPGTTLVHEPFEVEMIFDFPGVAMQGLYKIVVTMKAFGPRKIQRNTAICIEILGDMEPL